MRKIIAATASLLFVLCMVQGPAVAQQNSERGFVICHMPPGHPEHMRTITVGSRMALAAHLAHGDTRGPCEDIGGGDGIALLFVGHGEPVTVENGDVPIMFPDGEPFGPHAETLGVPESSQYTEWAAAYEEIATAMTYIFEDLNGNGIPHEIAIAPAGDVPDFFTWPAFHGSVYEHYAACNNYSPHNSSLQEHVESLEIDVCGTEVDIYMAFLDAVPRIRDVVFEIAETNHYSELVVVPMLVASSTHTQEVHDLVEETRHLIGDMELIVAEPFFEIPFMKKRLRNAVLAMADHLSGAIPEDVAAHNIGVVLASHGTPYVPPYPEFGWVEGEIFSELIPTEDAFHDEIGSMLPWMYRTGRMNYSSPTIEDALAGFEADGFTHIIVVPSAFPTAALHTMWDVANAAVGRAVLPHEGIVEHTRPSGMTVYYSSEGFADIETGRDEFRTGLAFIGESAVMEAMEEGPEGDFNPYVPCEPGMLCVTVDAHDITGSDLKITFYETTEADWPQAFEQLPMPDWAIMSAPPMPDHFPARLRIPLEGNLTQLSGSDPEGARMGMVIATADGMQVMPTDARGFSAMTLVHDSEEGMDFGIVDVAVPAEDSCLPGDICVTVTGGETTGPDLKLMLYIATDENWPQEFMTLPTPSWVVTETAPVPDIWPIHISIPLVENLYSFTSEQLEGSRLGLAVVTGVASNFVVEPTDARAFSAMTMVYTDGAVMDFGDVELALPAGDVCDLNPFHPDCLTSGLLWQEHMLGDEGFVPGAIYLDVADLDGDDVLDLVMVGEPHFEDPDLPLTTLKLGAYYMNDDLTVREMEIIDEWSEADPLLYSPWGVNVIEHAGEPMIIVGTNIPELAPLEEGTGAVLSYRRDGGVWVRSVVMENPDPTVTNYNAMIVVTSDIDNDGDEDIALSTAFGSSNVGNWMENTGLVDDPWIPHLQPVMPGIDPAVRGVLAYKSADLNGDGYPEVMYNGMFDVPGTDPPQYRGEIWLGINPGPSGWDSQWDMVVIDDDNWASADMWFHDFTGDGNPDLVANQIFNSTVTLYHHPGANLADSWVPEVIISGMASPSDMWLADMNGDGLMDVVSADHTAHKGVWHMNPGTLGGDHWQQNLIYRNIRLPGDFAMIDMDEDGDLDWVGTSMTLGQGFIVEQLHPAGSLVTTLSLPDGFSGDIRQLMVTLATELPVTGPPAAVLATIDNGDADSDGEGDVDQILNQSRDLTLALPDVGVAGMYHVVVVLFMDGGGQFAPVPGVDYMAASGPLTFGAGQVTVDLELMLVPGGAPVTDARSGFRGSGWDR